jgi:hypothetical protein
MNDGCCEIFSCMIEFRRVPLFSSITVHSYVHAAPCELLLNLCEQSSAIDWCMYQQVSLILMIFSPGVLVNIGGSLSVA